MSTHIQCCGVLLFGKSSFARDICSPLTPKLKERSRNLCHKPTSSLYDTGRMVRGTKTQQTWN